MVRLKPAIAIEVNNEMYLFQFHYGAIKTCSSLSSYRPTKLSFNSTMVRLKHVAGEPEPASKTSFNSTMVRLKHHPTLFTCLMIKRFNSTMVRLKL